MKNIQATGNLYGEHITIKQVSKIAASKEFEKGNTVYLQSSNMYPFGVWQNVIDINKDENESFENRVNSFTYYNCDSERGKYVHFYVKVS